MIIQCFLGLVSEFWGANQVYTTWFTCDYHVTPHYSQLLREWLMRCHAMAKWCVVMTITPSCPPQKAIPPSSSRRESVWYTSSAFWGTQDVACHVIIMITHCFGLATQQWLAIARCHMIITCKPHAVNLISAKQSMYQTLSLYIRVGSGTRLRFKFPHCSLDSCPDPTLNGGKGPNN